VSECDRESSIMLRRLPTGSCCSIKKADPNLPYKLRFVSDNCVFPMLVSQQIPEPKRTVGCRPKAHFPYYSHLDEPSFVITFIVATVSATGRCVVHVVL